jgi:hypothetical protein
MAEPVTVIVCSVLGLLLLFCGAASLVVDCAHAVLATGARRSAAKAHASLVRFMMTTLTHYLSEVSQPDVVIRLSSLPSSLGLYKQLTQTHEIPGLNAFICGSRHGAVVSSA